MARAKTKTKKTKKTARSKPAAKPKRPATKKTATAKKQATPKKKPAANKAASKAPKATDATEKQVASLLEDYESGAIDNAWDVIGDMYELDKALPKTSPQRAAFDKMYREIGEICRTSGD